MSRVVIVVGHFPSRRCQLYVGGASNHSRFSGINFCSDRGNIRADFSLTTLTYNIGWGSNLRQTSRDDDPRAETTRGFLARQLSALPADTSTVILDPSPIADAGLSVSPIGRDLAGIAYSHKLGRIPNSCVGDDLRGNERHSLGHGAQAEGCRYCGPCARYARRLSRNRPREAGSCLLALGFSGAFRRSELVALRVGNLVEVPDGFRVLIRRSNTDQAGECHEIVIPRGLKIRPVDAVQAWLRAGGISEGLLFPGDPSRWSCAGLGGCEGTT
jgi:hypothetical protein